MFVPSRKRTTDGHDFLHEHSSKIILLEESFFIDDSRIIRRNRPVFMVYYSNVVVMKHTK